MDTFTDLPRILIVDDIADSRTRLATLVSTLGYGVIEASGGQDALICMDMFSPDIVLLDLLMPGIDGFTVCRRIKQQNYGRWVPIVVLSGLDGEEHLLEALQAQADDFLHKPVNPAILASKLSNLGRALTLQAQLNTLLARSQAISLNSFDAILLVDPDVRIVEANPAATVMFGQTEKQLIGLPLNILLPKLNTSCHTEQPQNLQRIHVIRPDGSLVPAEAGLSQFNQNGENYLIVTLRDISERDRVDQLKQQFIATLSHELRTPLTSIIGALKMWKVGITPQNSNPQQVMLIEMADRNAGRLLGMVNELLDLNRSLAGKLQLHCTPEPLGELLDEVISNHLGYAQKHATVLELICPTPLRKLVLKIDRCRFMQIMANLISNACKFSPSGGAVTVRTTLTSHQCSIQVCDQGPGIPAEFMPQLFEPFAQADSCDNRRQGGSGLGLAITLRLVEALNGQINVQSSSQGSTFTVTFPLEAIT